ncbi:hypothetical protein ACFLTH_11420 [Bacteroidota bacterium]
MLKQIFSLLVYVSVAVFTFIILTTAFNNNAAMHENNYAKGELIGYSNCKIPGDTSFCFGHASNEDCIEYKYDGKGTLRLTHINSVFSLCPGKLTADITVNTGSIVIEEHETGIGCFEMCLYNLDYVINNLNPDTYSVKVLSPYPVKKRPLEFSVDLTHAGNGSFHLTRNVYPWGT